MTDDDSLIMDADEDDVTHAENCSTCFSKDGNTEID